MSVSEAEAWKRYCTVLEKALLAIRDGGQTCEVGGLKVRLIPEADVVAAAMAVRRPSHKPKSDRHVPLRLKLLDVLIAARLTPMSPDQLCAKLWGGNLPASAKSSIAVGICKLRKEGHLISRPSKRGYIYLGMAKGGAWTPSRRGVDGGPERLPR